MSILMLSYPDADAETADSIAEILRESGIDCIPSRRARDWTKTSTEEFDSLLMGCLSFIPVISPESLESQWLPYEVGYARGREKHVVGFMTTPSLAIPGYLSGLEMLKSLDELSEHLETCGQAAMLRRLASERS